MGNIKYLLKTEVPVEYHERIGWETQELSLSVSGRRPKLHVNVKCEKCDGVNEIAVNDIRNWCKGIRRGQFPGTHRKCRFSGRVIDGEGYARIYVGYDAEKNRAIYQLEHRFVMESVLGRPLTKKESIHHIDGDRLNNDPSNLQLRTSHHGKGARHACGDCGSENVVAVEI